MAFSITPTDLDLRDDGTGLIKGRITCTITNDDPMAAALGAASRVDMREVVLPRAAWNALLNALRRVSSDSWPDATLPHVIAKAP